MLKQLVCFNRVNTPASGQERSAKAVSDGDGFDSQPWLTHVFVGNLQTEFLSVLWLSDGRDPPQINGGRLKRCCDGWIGVFVSYYFHKGTSLVLKSTAQRDW